MEKFTDLLGDFIVNLMVYSLYIVFSLATVAGICSGYVCRFMIRMQDAGKITNS